MNVEINKVKHLYNCLQLFRNQEAKYIYKHQKVVALLPDSKYCSPWLHSVFVHSESCSHIPSFI